MRRERYWSVVSVTSKRPSWTVWSKTWKSLNWRTMFYYEYGITASYFAFEWISSLFFFVSALRASHRDHWTSFNLKSIENHKNEFSYSFFAVDFMIKSKRANQLKIVRVRLRFLSGDAGPNLSMCRIVDYLYKKIAKNNTIYPTTIVDDKSNAIRIWLRIWMHFFSDRIL